MTKSSRAVLATLCLTTALLLLPPILAAQDQFGRSVAVGDGEVIVMKAFAGRGPPALYVFAPDAAGGWRLSDRLQPAISGETGEGFGPSIALDGGTLLAGSGDPSVEWGAHVYRRGPATWEEGPGVPLTAASTPSRSTSIDLAAVMRILQPPRRVVAINGDRAVVAVVGGPSGTGGVRIFDRPSGGAPWTLRTRLSQAERLASDEFGSALALNDERVFVGAPRQGVSGAVHIYVRQGGTNQEAVLEPQDLAPESGFGGTITLAGDALLVGAPGTGATAGTVIAYARDAASGEWSEVARLAPAEGAPGDRFGAAIAARGDEVWVGAPGAENRRGRVHRFARAGGEGWRGIGELAVSDLESGFGFGFSVALGDGLGVVGVPGAVGGRGRAAVFARSGDDDWGVGSWIDAGNDLTAVAGAEVQCGDDGQADRFSCENVDLLAFLPVEALGGGPGERVSDVWGWSDPVTGREYALVGRTGGAAFVDITNPTSPTYVGFVPANRSGARDLKVYRDHLFFTGDGAGAHGLIVFNLARLRDVRDAPVTFEPDAKYDGIASAHNLVINTGAGFAFPVGASGGGETCGGGLHMVDIRDPTNPTFAGCYTDTEGLIWQGRTHDAQCVVYDGPDRDYVEREICFASNETALRIVDVTDKESPIPLSTATYPGMAYVHQGWLTDDRRYFYLNDELDELVGQADRTRTLVLDVTDLDDPLVIGQFLGPSGATDHNLYVKGDRMYQANYQAGLRVIDISDPENPVEIGFFDTTPYDGDPPGFNGAWTAYPFFDSGSVIVSSMNEGLFVLAPRPRALIP